MHEEPVSIDLNPNLDAASLRSLFNQLGRIRIDQFLAGTSADQICEALQTELHWELLFLDADERNSIDWNDFHNLPAQRQTMLLDKIQEQVTAGSFQLLLCWHNLDEKHVAEIDPESKVVAAVEFLRGDAFMSFTRAITGTNVTSISASASWYRPGHFLLPHTDGVGNEDRKLAYVLNLSRDWIASWGGLLQFHNSHGEIVDSLLPVFNSLSIFRVGPHHSVSRVEATSEQPRLAISGWIYT